MEIMSNILSIVLFSFGIIFANGDDKASKCDDNWVHLNNSCYFVSWDKAATFTEADETCRSFGGNVWRIDSDKVQILLQNRDSLTLWTRLTLSKEDHVEEISPCWVIERKLLEKNSYTPMEVDCNLKFGYICEVEANLKAIASDKDKCIQCKHRRSKRSPTIDFPQFGDPFAGPFESRRPNPRFNFNTPDDLYSHLVRNFPITNRPRPLWVPLTKEPRRISYLDKLHRELIGIGRTDSPFRRSFFGRQSTLAPSEIGGDSSGAPSPQSRKDLLLGRKIRTNQKEEQKLTTSTDIYNYEVIEDASSLIYAPASQSESPLSNGTKEPSSNNGTVEHSSSNGTEEHSSSNGTVEHSSSNGTVEHSSSNGTEEHSSSNGTEKSSQSNGSTIKPSLHFPINEPIIPTFLSTTSTTLGGLKGSDVPTTRKAFGNDDSTTTPVTTVTTQKSTTTTTSSSLAPSTTVTTTPTSTIPTTTMNKYACLDGTHFKFYGTCYYFEETKKESWESARMSCGTIMSSSLASFNSRYEYETVLEILHSTKEIESEIWIGFYVESQNSTLQWNKTMLAMNSHWSNDEPIMFPGWWQMNLDASKGTCGAVATDAADQIWTLKDCELELPYLCSYQTNNVEFMEEGDCVEGWYDKGEWCYRFFKDLKTWREAEEDCIHLGGHLSSIGDSLEEAFLKVIPSRSKIDILIKDLMNSFYSDDLETNTGVTFFWVGYFVDPNSAVIWADGQNTQYYQWDTDSVYRKNANQYCGMANDLTMHLSNYTCDSYLSYICKRKKGIFTNVRPDATVVSPIYCPNDATNTWISHIDSCYKLAVATATIPGETFREAMESCNMEGAQLVSIESHEENYWLLSQLALNPSKENLEMWIGGKRNAHDGRFYWAKEGSPPIQYSNWASGEPNNGDNMEDCATMYSSTSGQWNDDHCTKQHGYICEKPSNDSIQHARSILHPTEGSCPAYWTKIDHKCIRFYPYEKRDFDRARELCAKNHVLGDLLSIQTPKQQAMASALLAVHWKNVWIGLREIRNEFYWTDQSSLLNYTNWAKVQPSGHYRSCGIIVAHGNFGKWSAESCSSDFGYACQMPIDPKWGVGTNELPFQARCAPPYDAFYHFGGECYRIVEQAETWQEAEKTCQKMGAHLTSVLSTKENSFLWSQFSPLVKDQIWIGLKRSFFNNKLVWSDLWPPFYTNWKDQAVPEVDDNGCVTLSMVDGTWKVVPCEQPNLFVCKYSKFQFHTPGNRSSGVCKSNEWLDFGGNYCYLLLMEEAFPWEQGSKFCKALGSNLVSVHTEEDMFILKKLAEHSDTAIWLGLKRQDDGAFYWTDNSSSMNYVNWNANEPNYLEEKCVEVLSGSGLWNDIRCEQLRIVLCRGPKEKPLPLPAEIIHNTEEREMPANKSHLKTAHIVGLNLGLLLLALMAIMAGTFAYRWYKTRLVTMAGGVYGFENVTYTSTNRGPSNVVLGQDPLEHTYWEGECILEDEDEETDEEGAKDEKNVLKNENDNEKIANDRRLNEEKRKEMAEKTLTLQKHNILF